MIPGHEMRVETRTEWRTGYANVDYKRGYPVLVCSCGEYAVRIYDDYRTSALKEEILKLRHESDILAAMVIQK